MEIAIRAAAAGVVAVTAALMIKKHNSELALCVCVVAGAVILLPALGHLGEIGETLAQARRLSGLSPAVTEPVMKCVAIGLVTKIGADICRDAGGSGVASGVELAGAIAALVTALPLVGAFMRMMEGLL